jgi:hypothetical protein
MKTDFSTEQRRAYYYYQTKIEKIGTTTKRKFLRVLPGTSSLCVFSTWLDLRSELAHTVVHAVIKFQKKLIHIKIDSYKYSIYKELKTFYSESIANTACGKDQHKNASIHKKTPQSQVVHFSGTAASVHDPHGCGLSKCLKNLVQSKLSTETCMAYYYDYFI